MEFKTRNNLENKIKGGIFGAVLGNDTDTTACVAGGLAGIYYGFESIYSAKPDYIEKLAKIEMLNSLVDDFALFIENK